MVFVYTMSTKEPYWTVDVIEPEQTEDAGWTYGGGTLSQVSCHTYRRL